MENKNISLISEFELVNKIKNQFINSKNDKNIVVGIGDDSFCFKSGKNNICVTKDILFEGVHFKREWISPVELGKKSIEVSISDMAAMGNVKPEYAFVGLGIPLNTSEIFVKNLYKGLKAACDKYKMTIAGGDTVRADKIMISITIVGVGKGKLIKRNGANSGDLIGVTNTFGDAGAGVALLYRYGTKRIYNKDEHFLISKQNNPKARLEEAVKISKYLTSLTDASDGLYISVDLLARSSCKGADVYMEKIPISSSMKNIFKKDKNQLDFALFGGEDYELVFTVPNSKAMHLKKIIPQISYIGKINSSRKVRYFYNGKEQKIKYSGFKHF
jgi:thiamine-monophosphate kinase